MATTTTKSKITKKDLQERIGLLEAEVTSLQNELGERSLQLSDVEDELSDARSSLEEAKHSERLLRFERSNVADLLDAIEGIANQFYWSISMFDTIMLYKGGDQDFKSRLISQLSEADAQFIDNFEQGVYDSKVIAQSIDEDRRIIQLNEADEDDVMTILVSLLEDVPEQEFDLNDPEEDEDDPDSGLV